MAFLKILSLEKLLNKDLPGGAASREMRSDTIPEEIQKKTTEKTKGRSLLEKVLNKDLPGGAASKEINQATIKPCKTVGGRSLLEKAQLSQLQNFGGSTIHFHEEFY